MAIKENPKTLELNDIQGMLTRGYARLFQTAYWHIRVNSSTDGKNWLKQILPLVDSGDHTQKRTKTLHIAFAVDGLRALGLEEENINNFPIPFREGISTNNRNRILGDYGQNDPSKWSWGAANDEHLVLIFHAPDVDQMNSFLEEQRQLVSKYEGIEIKNELRGFLREDNKEPFGFHDGISQPLIKGCGKSGPENDIIATGEFVLGHKNEHGDFPDSPIITKAQGDLNHLSDGNNFGKNGSFMVFRQMQQHVDKFWSAMEKHTKNADGSVNEEAKIKLASKCIGRWPSGASLVNFPDSDPGGSLSNDDFGYAEDPDGLKCPFGSHLRRNNPRDTLRWYNQKQSLKITRRHRIIRRGRTYLNDDANQETGLIFICFNANIELQFEFIQHAWANNNQMRHLTNDVDVITGVPAEGNPNNDKRQFTIQKEPVNEFVEELEQFVTIKGGAYYFLPSISSLHYLTTL